MDNYAKLLEQIHRYPHDLEMNRQSILSAFKRNDISDTQRVRLLIESERLQLGKKYGFFLAIEANLRPVQYRSLLPSQEVIAIGEEHDFNSHRAKFLDLLHLVRFTIVFLECLPSSEQRYINDFLSHKNDGELIVAYLKKRFKDIWESYFEIIEFCKKKGITIIGLETGTFNYEMGRIIIKQMEMHDLRDHHWASVMSVPLRERKGPVALFCGCFHLTFFKKMHPSSLCIIFPLKSENQSAPPILPESVWDQVSFERKIQEYHHRYHTNQDFMIQSPDGIWHTFNFSPYSWESSRSGQSNKERGKFSWIGRFKNKSKSSKFL